MSNHSTIKLKICPFCRTHKAELISFKKTIDRKQRTLHQVVCWGCGAMCDTSLHRPAAARKWNRRHG